MSNKDLTVGRITFSGTTPRFDHGTGAALAQADHHACDRGRVARTIEQTRAYINSDHPCCIPVGDAAWMLHAYDELKDEVESWRTRFQAIVGASRPDSAGNEVLHLTNQLKETRRQFEALINTISASTSPWLRKVAANANAAFKNIGGKHV